MSSLRDELAKALGDQRYGHGLMRTPAEESDSYQAADTALEITHSNERHLDRIDGIEATLQSAEQAVAERDALKAEIARLTDQVWRTTTCLNAAKAMIGVYKRHISRQRQRADSAEAKLDAVIREVTEICDSFKAADKDAPDYLYSLGRLEMADWVRAAIPRALATLEQEPT